MLHTYTIHGHQLETVNTVKCMGVALQKDAARDKHLNIMCSKASRALRPIAH